MKNTMKGLIKPSVKFNIELIALVDLRIWWFVDCPTVHLHQGGQLWGLEMALSWGVNVIGNFA